MSEYLHSDEWPSRTVVLVWALIALASTAFWLGLGYGVFWLVTR